MEHRPVFSAKVAIVIKALNEEKHIKKSVESAVKAVEPFSGIVILADSGSTDKTLDIASLYPIHIVQLANRNERCCGIGAQLGYQFLDCDYVYILDGDMEIDTSFLSAAIAHLEHNPKLGGVAGMVEEFGGGNYEFESRKAQSDGRVMGIQNELDMGGLYRGSALKAIGYMTNRNLHSYEEKELGLRVREAGYLLERINIPAIKHYGKTDDSISLLWKRWKSHHIDGPGEWMRANVGNARFFHIAFMFKQFWLVVFSWALIVAGVLLLPFSSAVFVFSLCVQLIFVLRFLWKNKSMKNGLIGYLNINFYAAGMLRGLSVPHKDPASNIDYLIIK